MSVDRRAGIQFENPNVTSGELIELITECDGFDNARNVAETKPGIETSCGDCPLTVIFDADSRILDVNGICGRITS